MRSFFHLIILITIFNNIGWTQRFDIGLAGVYGDDISTFGQNTRLYINSDDHRFCLGPEFSWFLQDREVKGNEEHTRDLIEFNFNGHINFDIIGPLGFYPLIGLNYSQEKEESFISGELEETKTLKKWGMNIGTGLHLKLPETWIMYLEYDHLFSDLNQNTITLGVLYGFGRIKDSHHTPKN